jgi:hypothetical protein
MALMWNCDSFAASSMRISISLFWRRRAFGEENSLAVMKGKNLTNLGMASWVPSSRGKSALCGGRYQPAGAIAASSS